MSKEAVAEFLIAVDGKADLRGELGVALEGKDEQAPAVVEVAARHGFDFNAQEYSEALAAASELQEGALSDDELEAVAGGMYQMPAPRPGCGTQQRLLNITLKDGVASFNP